MPPADLLIAFALATLVFAYMPGPALLYTAARTISGGRRAGFQAALGLHAGGYLHVIAAALGLALVFQAIPQLYLGLKLVGAGYLIFLGVRLWITAEQTSNVALEPTPDLPAFWQSAAVEMLNPKTALFYLAFLPQFTDPSAALPIWAQMLVLGTILNVVFSSADVLCVVLADRVLAVMRGSAQAGRWAKRLGGGLLVGLGLNIAFGEAKA